MKAKHAFTLIGVLAVLLPNLLFGQEKEINDAYSRNCLYLEVGGAAALYSVNYEYRFREHLSGRIGFTVLPDDLFNPRGVRVGGPVLLSYLAGGGGHYFEIGLGVLGLSPGSRRTHLIYGTATLGYRYQPMTGGFLFRIGFTPLMSSRESFPWGGLSVGWAF